MEPPPLLHSQTQTCTLRASTVTSGANSPSHMQRTCRAAASGCRGGCGWSGPAGQQQGTGICSGQQQQRTDTMPPVVDGRNLRGSRGGEQDSSSVAAACSLRAAALATHRLCATISNTSLVGTSPPHRLDAQLGVAVHRLCVRPVAQVEQRGQLGGIAAGARGARQQVLNKQCVRSLPPQQLPTDACATPSGRTLAASRQSR